MEEHLIPYFTAEKHEALLFMLAGLAAIGISTWLLLAGSAYRAAAFPLVAIAAIQLTVGGTVYFRTDNQVAELTHLYEQDPAGFKAEETKRMQAVINNFVVYRWIEIALLGIGIILALTMCSHPAWLAAGAGLAAQAGIMLALDYFAERRAAGYMQFVVGLTG